MSDDNVTDFPVVPRDTCTNGYATKATVDQIIRGLRLRLEAAEAENRLLREQVKWSGYRAHQQATLDVKPKGES